MELSELELRLRSGKVQGQDAFVSLAEGLPANDGAGGGGGRN